MADKFRTNHYQLNIGQNELNEHILDSISSLDEPYADPSILPSYLLSKHISSKYKVAISEMEEMNYLVATLEQARLC